MTWSDFKMIFFNFRFHTKFFSTKIYWFYLLLSNYNTNCNSSTPVVGGRLLPHLSE
jgi:hypothetical protein